MKKIILFLLCLWAFPVAASHIVGGEFEIIHISGDRYRINLILYFDELNGSVNARDPNVEARIFRKRDNALMMDLFLPLSSQTPVSYTQPACSSGEIVTTRILYSGTFRLTAQQFADAQGYYLAWERCCRNYDITNIYSEDPARGGRYAGQTFYLEFPAVVKDGQPFINSSPRLFPPLNDYACPRRPYYVDFAGTDDDGDSLVYSIVTPLNTKSADALPPPNLRPRPRPYPVVTYRSPFSETNILAGAPDLKISTDGFLTVTPTVSGLFVFAVRCEEYRDGEKIGELRRDFQMLVVDGCNPADPPKVLGKKSTDGTFAFDNEMNIAFSNDVADTERCIQVQVSDEDATRDLDNFTEKVTIRAIPLNFKKDVSGVLPEITSATLVNGSTATFDICFDKCPFIENGPFQIGIVAYDDACSLPLSDTLRITVTVEPPENADAYFTTAGATEVLFEGAKKEWPIEALDADMDPMVLGVIAGGFNMSEVGMELQVLEQNEGSYKAKLVWDTRCDVYDFRTRTSFDITFLIEDMDECNFSDPDTVVFHLSVKLPGNEDPVISTDLSAGEVENGIRKKIFESVSFNVFGDDVDGNELKLSAQGVNFDLAAYGMTFPDAIGPGHVESPFNWQLLCDKLNLAEKDTFGLLFIVVDDANKCRLYKADTLSLWISAEPPDNEAPILNVASTNLELPFENNQQDLLVGQQISLGIASTDTDKSPRDHLVIEMIGAEGSVQPEGYIFEGVEGEGSIATTFTWNTDCTIFVDGLFENHYTFTFRTYDNRCASAKGDTVEVAFTIRDVDNDVVEFLPPNFVSADHDPGQRNEYFAMVRLNPQTGELEDVLPKDNCVGHFVGITIYNRWGTPVFESTSRDFQWYPDEGSSGVYFYTLTFSDKEYKGSVTVRN
ncbi:MAG: gliding motility-associated C-terminal domain-containing protein [Cyclobacteriaceae bacterium]